MSEKIAKTYTAEFKESAVKLAVESGQPIALTAKDLGVNVNTLHGWIHRLHRPKGTGRATGKQEHKVIHELTAVLNRRHNTAS